MDENEIKRIAHQTGLTDCIDDAYLERGDWVEHVDIFSRAIRQQERERVLLECKALVDTLWREGMSALKNLEYE